MREFFGKVRIAQLPAGQGTHGGLVAFDQFAKGTLIPLRRARDKLALQCLRIVRSGYRHTCLDVYCCPDFSSDFFAGFQCGVMMTTCASGLPASRMETCNSPMPARRSAV